MGWLRTHSWVFSILGAVVMGAAGVSPQEAASNLSGWLQLVGIHDLPTWLLSEQADTWGIFIGAAIFTFSLAVFAYRKARPAIKRVAVESQPPHEMIRLEDAIDWVIDNSEWGESDNRNMKILPAAVKLRQAARNGDLTISGRREINRDTPFGNFDNTWEEIPKDYWSTHHFKLEAVCLPTVHEAVSETEPVSRGNLADASNPTYAMLRVWRDELEKRWPKANDSPFKKPAPLPQESKATRDIWLSDAVRYIAFGERAAGLPADGGIAACGDAVERLHQAAADGKITIWGRKNRNFGAFIEIAKDYWSDYAFDWYGWMNSTTPEDWHTNRLSSSRGYDPDLYYGLKTSKAQIAQLRDRLGREQH